MIRILVVFGTRPEAIKLAPVVKALRQAGTFEVRVCVTAQHRQMLDQVLVLFAMTPDVDLDLMQPGRDSTDLTARGSLWSLAGSVTSRLLVKRYFSTVKLVC